MFTEIIDDGFGSELGMDLWKTIRSSLQNEL